MDTHRYRTDCIYAESYRMVSLYNSFLCANTNCFCTFSRDQELKLQLTVQKFFLKHLQKLESNKAFVLKMQNYKQVERDYYDLFSNLSRREIYRRTRRVSMLKERAISSLNSETRALDSTSRMSFLTRGTLTQQPFDRSAFETSTRDFASTSERSDLDRAKGSTPSKARASSLRIPRESSLARSLSIFSEVGEYKDGSDAMVNAIHSPSVDSILKTRSEHNISPNKRAKQRDYVLTTQRFRPIPCIPTAHFSILRGWVKSSAHNTKIHSRFASTMERNPKTVEENRAFKDRFEKESQRSFIHVHTQAGVLEVIPMQALHIPISKHPMLVRLSYGNEVCCHATPDYLTWTINYTLF